MFSKGEYGATFSHQLIDRCFRLVEYITLTSAIYYFSQILESPLISAIYWICYFLLYSESQNIAAYSLNHNKDLIKRFPKYKKFFLIASYIIAIMVMTVLQLSINQIIGQKLLIK